MMRGDGKKRERDVVYREVRLRYLTSRYGLKFQIGQGLLE